MLPRMAVTIGDGSPALPLTPTWGDRLGCLWSAASCWIMTGLFVTAWWWPRELDNGAWVKLGVGVLVLEFISIHSGAFLNHLINQKLDASRTRTLIACVAFYCLFGVAIALAFRSWWLFGSFAFLLASRIQSGLVKQTDMDRALSQRRVVASTLLFLLLTFATIFSPVPRGGIDGYLLREVWPDRGRGLWEESPERALAMGAGYFLVLGLVELRAPRSWRRPPPAGPATSLFKSRGS